MDSQFVELLDQRVIVAHNASFDTRFLRAKLARAHYVTDAPLVSLCTVQLEGNLLPGRGRSLADYFRATRRFSPRM